MNGTLHILAPILSLSFFALVLLGIDASEHPDVVSRNRLAFWISLIGFAISIGLIQAPVLQTIAIGQGMLVWDGLGYFVTSLSIASGVLVILMGVGCSPLQKLRLSAYCALLFLAIAGTILMACANDLIMVFLSIELASLPSFALAGYLREEGRSNESALKFFVVGAFSSAMMAYGISILYGLLGTTSLLALDWSVLMRDHPAVALFACMLLLVGVGFKIALVPFHVWVPDAFVGAPVPIAGFLSIAPKLAGAIVALRVFGVVGHPAMRNVTLTMALLAAVTMTVANFIALRQTNIVRLLAYSSIAHMGYALLGVVASSSTGTTSVFAYGWIYLFMNLGAFTVVTLVVSQTGSGEFSALSGFGQRNRVLAAALALFLFGLAGIPPTAGFLAKFYVLYAALEAGWTKLAILAAVNTVVSVAYYFRVLKVMYFESAPEHPSVRTNPAATTALAVSAFATLALGLAPEFVLPRLSALVSVDNIAVPVSLVGATSTTPVVPSTESLSKTSAEDAVREIDE